MTSTRDLWIGSYPAPGASLEEPPEEGIWYARLEVATGRVLEARLVLQMRAPSFLAVGETGGMLYAVNEARDGRVSVCTVRGGRTGEGPSLAVAAEVPSGGRGPCHLTVVPGLGIVVANYGSGSVGLIRLTPSGLPEDGAPHQVVQLHGTGPNQARQAASHAHFVLPVPGGETLLVSDLGGDELRRCRVDRDARCLVDDGTAVALPPGAGPRHAVFSEDGRWLYVVGELDGQIHRVRWDARTATGRCVDAVPLPGPAPQAAHITRVGATLVVGVRGTNVLSRHQTGPDGQVGPGTTVPLPGMCPRHHADVGPWYIVAQQDAGGVAILDATGRVADTIPVPAPACVLPVPDIN